jgi:Xaa-Pro aminopeptidase
LEFEEANLTVSEYNTLKKNFTLVPSHNRIEALRMTKKDHEITSIKQAAKLTDECFSYIRNKIKPGVTETELVWEIESFIRKSGATLAFSPIVAFNSHSSQPHYQGMTESGSLSHTLTPPALVLLDFGARVNGYCGDMTRMVFVGPPKADWIRAYHAVLEAQKRALDALDRGERSGAALDRIARTSIEKAGFTPYSHSLGHAVGLAIHEAPRLTIKNDEQLKLGMVFSIEPAIYLESRFGIRIEDLVLLKKDGPEILSKSPKYLTK